MNDLVLQFFKASEAVKCVDFNDLNDPANFDDYLNVGEGVLKIEILSNDQGRDFIYPGWKAFADRMVPIFKQGI